MDNVKDTYHASLLHLFFTTLPHQPPDAEGRRVRVDRTARTTAPTPRWWRTRGDAYEKDGMRSAGSRASSAGGARAARAGRRARRPRVDPDPVAVPRLRAAPDQELARRAPGGAARASTAPSCTGRCSASPTTTRRCSAGASCRPTWSARRATSRWRTAPPPASCSAAWPPSAERASVIEMGGADHRLGRLARHRDRGARPVADLAPLHGACEMEAAAAARRRAAARPLRARARRRPARGVAAVLHRERHLPHHHRGERGARPAAAGALRRGPRRCCATAWRRCATPTSTSRSATATSCRRSSSSAPASTARPRSPISSSCASCRTANSLLFASGRYVDRIALAPEPRYEERVVICDSRAFDTLLAIPL